MAQPDFWRDQNTAREISQRADGLRQTAEEWDTLIREVHDALELARNGTSSDAALEAELANETQRLRKHFEKLEFLVLFSGPHDQRDAIVSIHAGTGGTEAQDWAEMLLRMYLRYCERRGFSINIIDQTTGQEAGIKSVTFEVRGRNAYGYLRSEAGVHRLVRISPFDAEKMRHTSFALVDVLPELPEGEGAVIRDDEIKIETMRAGGHGGQGVNTTDSAVRITHLPTGIVVKVQNERSQLQNKKMAMTLLSSHLVKLNEVAHGQELAKIRGELAQAAWGNQIRSYVLQPYRMVKDHRTEHETQDTDAILDGNLDEFVESYLRYSSKQRGK